MNENNRVHACDLPIAKLAPRSGRKVGKKQQERLEASLRAVGLLQPLVVSEHGDRYDILDGHLRHGILQDLGVTTIPCLVFKEMHQS